MSKLAHLRRWLLCMAVCGTMAGSRSAGNVEAASRQDPNAPLRVADYTPPIRIACVGDSITAGLNASTAAASYPPLLARLLGSQFVVGNFGVSGTTMLKSGNLPYWSTPAQRQIAEFSPQVVVVMLGTNDSKARNWADQAHFAGDATAIIQYFRALPSRPRIWLCLPPPASSNSLYIQGDVIDTQIVPLLRRMAVATQAGVIDIHGALLGHRDLLSDGVHPNDNGYVIVASTVYEALSGAPAIWPASDVFLDSVTVTITPPPVSPVVAYTLDGSDPGPTSPRFAGPVVLSHTTLVKARALWPDGSMSPITTARFVRASPLPSVPVSAPANGVTYRYYEGDAAALQKPAGPNVVAHGSVPNFVLAPRRRDRYFGLTFDGYVAVAADGMYEFYTMSDDGSLLNIDGRLVVDNFRSHRMVEQSGKIALRAGLHSIEVSYYQLVGAMGLEVSYAGPGLPKQPVPDFVLSHASAAE